MLRLLALIAIGLMALSQDGSAQESGGFTITRGTDTVAVEQFSREEVELTGTLIRRSGKTVVDRVRYQATLVDDQSAVLIELSDWRGDDPESGPARQTARVIFKDDSVAVDDHTRGAGLVTRVLPTTPTAIGYLNLSTAFLEQATRRAARSPRDSLAVPFFNLGGGQTVTGTVRRLGPDSSVVHIGSVDYHVRVDPEGRILGGAVPAQSLLISRTGAH
jgi:hypothetical protein